MPHDAYIAGPLFNEGERWFGEQIDSVAQRVGLSTFLPHRDGTGPVTSQADACRVFREDQQAIDDCPLLIASLNGVALDDGTCWEIGYAFARGKHLVGIHTDWRLRFQHETVNLMIECSLHKLVHSLDALEAYLREYQRTQT
jgi:nucleoside 2-deoxyribosyltransferase